MASQTASANAPRSVAVIGAGAVGICAALHLQRDGHRVTVYDPRPPGEGASFGNAGVISNASVMPESTPGLWRKLPAMLADGAGPVWIRWRTLPQRAPYLTRFFLSGTPKRAAAISKTLTALSAQAYPAHRALADAAGVGNLLRGTGWLKAFEDEAEFAAFAPELRLLEERGIAVEVLNRDELRQLEPALAPIFARAVFLPGSGSVESPVRLVQGYAAHFVGNGGAIEPRKVTHLKPADGRVTIDTDGGPVAADAAVIAAGAWSKTLAAQVGCRVPLDTERGYHAMFAGDGGLRHPVLHSRYGYVVSPMADGARMTFGAELAGLHAPPDWRRLRAMVPRLRRALPGLTEEVTSEWLGFRPSLPDSLPVIGQSPDHPSVILAFGHGHIGLSLSAITGQFVADLLAGRTPEVDLAPTRADRF